MFWVLLAPFILMGSIMLYIVYMFFIKIYIDAAKIKKMDPELKLYIAPFSGVQGVQKQNIRLYGDSHRYVKKMIKENPDQKAYLTNLGSKPFLILCDAKLIKELSLNPKKFKKYNMFKHSDKAYTQGIFFVEGEQWTSERSIVRHSFNYQSLKKMVPIMNDTIEKYFGQIEHNLKESSSGKRVYNVLNESQLLIGQMLVRLFFSEKASTKKVGQKSLSLALAEFTTNMFERSRTGQNVLLSLFFGESVIKYNFDKEDKRLEKMIKEIRTILLEIIDERIARENDEERDFIYDYISQMKEINAKIKQAEAEGKPHKLRKITREQIIHQLISFYFAGIDTTGHLVAMAIYSLGQYPSCKQKIIDQVKQIIKSPEDITYESLQKLEYTGKFLDECLRKWPPASGILVRMAREDIQIGPYSLPKGALVGTNILGLMYNEKYYKDPQVFDPERWNDKTLYNAQPYSFIPFSAGSRSCIGKYLALMESKLMLIRMLSNFEIDRTDTPLRMHAKFLYEPIDEDLVFLKAGGERFPAFC